MLLGNKCDLPNKVVTSQMGQEFAKAHNMGFMEVSAKSDIGIKAAFTSLSSAIYQQKSGAPAIPEDRGQSVMIKAQKPPAAGEQPVKKKGCC